MDFHYISPSTLPSRAANSVHVIWQCDALSRAAIQVTLYAKRAVAEADQLPSAIFHAYGVNNTLLKFVTYASSISRGDNLRIALMAVRAIRRANRPCIILSRNLYAAFVLAVIYKMPLLFETHQLETGIRKMMQRAIIRCSGVKTIAISDRLVEYLTSHHGVAPSDALVLHDAAPEGIVPVDPAARRSKLTQLVMEAIGEWKMICGYFGHLYRGRGIEVVEAMASARPDCLFLVYGGTEAAIRERRAENKRVNLFFMGHVSHPMARDLMCLMDVLLMPYQENVSIGIKGHDTARWMSPMKMFEYLGSGVPIISSNLAALREVLQDGINSLLVAPSDNASWIAALDKLATDRNFARSIGNNAHVQYVSKYTWSVRAEKILEAARQL